MIEGIIQLRCDDCGEMESIEPKGVDFEQFIAGVTSGLMVLTDTDWKLSPVLCPVCRDLRMHDAEAERARGDR